MHKNIKVIFGNFNSIHLKKWLFTFNENHYYKVSYERTEKKIKNCYFLKRNKNFLILSSIYNFFYLLFKFYKLRPKVIIIHYINEITFLVYLLSFLIRFKIIIFPWGSDLNIKTNFITKYFKKLALRKSNLIITDGYHIKNKLVSLFKINIDKIKIYNFPISFDGIQDVKNRYKKTVFTKFIFSNRSLDKIYSIDILIKAFKLFLIDYPSYKLIIIGDGELKETLIKLVYKIGLEKNVIFTGKLNFEEMIQYLVESELFVSTSTSDAGLSSSIAEALFLKKKIVVSDNSDNHIWIKNFDNGLLFKTDDINDLYNKLKLAIENDFIFKDSSYKNFLSKFSHEKVMPQIKDLSDKF